MLLVVYLASLAPGVTFWDAGEFIAAIHTLGIPHPPGTPLYVLIGKTWTLALGMASPAYALNLLSAVSTAVAGAITAHLVFRSTHQRVVAVAATVIAGTMSTAWLNATETEVYAPSLLLSMLILAAGEQSGRLQSWRWLVLTAYLIALAVPLHLTALVAAPAAIVLASEAIPATPLIVIRQSASRVGDWLNRWFPEWQWSRALTLGAVAVLAMAASSLSPLLATVGIVTLGIALWKQQGSVGWKATSILVAVVIGISSLAFLIIRAQHDPGINQGDPSNIARWIAVITREQYAVAGLWPRQAPLWIQAANMLQYFDWQLALSLAPEPPLSIGRAAMSVGGVALGVIGARAHRRMDPRRWRAVFALLLAGSIGVMLYLNLKAGPSIGWGVLPDSAPHEPRERDYFFVLAFWAWAIWVAIGAREVAAAVARRAREAHVRARLEVAVVVVIAAMPVLLNWSVVERRSEPSASLPRRSAQAFLASAPKRAVLFVAGDNDSYPLWYLQHVEGFRRDVAVITIPITPANWYRDEMMRRHNLQAPGRWGGLSERLAALANDARRQGRPVAAAVSVPPNERYALGDLHILRGWVWVEADSMARAVSLSLRAVELDAALRDAQLNAKTHAALGRLADPMSHDTWKSLTSTEQYMAELLACPRFARESVTKQASADSLDSTCNFR